MNFPVIILAVSALLSLTRETVSYPVTPALRLPTSDHELFHNGNSHKSFEYCMEKTILQCPYAVKAILKGIQFKCTNLKVEKSLHDVTYSDLLCHEAANLYCKSPICSGRSFYPCVIEQNDALKKIIARACGAEISNDRSADNVEGTSSPSSFSSNKHTDSFLLPSMSPSSSASVSPTASTSQTASTSPTASPSASPSSSASVSPTASVSASPSASASASVSASPSASVSVSASPSTSARPACESISGMSCAGECAAGGTQIFEFQCSGSDKCCRAPDCIMEPGQSCVESCFLGATKQDGFFCQSGQVCCKFPACESMREQECRINCDDSKGETHQSSFFCKGIKKCCRSAPCLSTPGQSCESQSCPHGSSEVTGFCDGHQRCCNASSHTVLHKSVDTETISAPTPAAMAEYDDCTEAGGECRSDKCDSESEFSTSLACSIGNHCCVSSESARCKGENRKCVLKTTCDGFPNPKLLGCYEGDVCCETKQY